MAMTHHDVAEATVTTEAEMRPQRVPVNVYEATEAMVLVAPLPAVRCEDVRIELRPGDRILMCSDGVHGVVDDTKIRDLLASEPDPQKCADALCRLAIDNGSRDNVSCIVLNLK